MVLQSLTSVLQHLPQQWHLLPATPFLLLAILLLLSIVFLAATTRRRRHHTTTSTSYHLPPRASGLPIIGNLHQMGALRHQSLRELARRYGPVMMLQLGTVPAVAVSSADAARDVLKTHDADCCSRPDTPGPRQMSYQHSDVAFSPYSEQWRERRRLLVIEFLSKRRIQATWNARKIEVNKLIGRLSSVGRKPVALEDHIFGYMDGIVGTVAFGNVYGTEHFASKELHHVMDEAIVVRSRFSAEDYFPNAIGRLVDRLTGVASQRERVFREFDAFFEMMLEQQHESARGTKPDNDNGCGGLINALVGLMKEHQQGCSKFSRDVVKGILVNTFFGAIDTGAVTIIWAMAELVRKPQVLRKAQEEIRAVVGSKGRVEQDDMPKLRYLRAVVMETLRLHPALPLLVPRETMRRVTVSGYDVPAKTRVFVNVWAIGRDPASWADPEDFVPERFEGEEAASGFFNQVQFELLPFGAGRRRCPGIDMGLATTEFALANLLYCFDWELPEGLMREDVCMEEAGGLIVHKKTPLFLVPIRYNHTSFAASE